MPIYEYRCQSCGHECEVLQKLSDPQLTDCPACQAPALKKKVSAAGFRLKGGGWYETDFKSGNKKNVAGDKKPEASKTGDKDGGKQADTSKASTDTGTKSDSSSKPKGSKSSSSDSKASS